MQLLAVEEVTPQIEEYLSEDVTLEEKASAKKMKSNRRPNMNFFEMGIPAGSILKYKEDDIQVTVVEEKKVSYNGNISSLTGVTREVMGLDYSVQPAPHWTYEGRILTDIYNETYVLEGE